MSLLRLWRPRRCKCCVVRIFFFKRSNSALCILMQSLRCLTRSVRWQSIYRRIGRITTLAEVWWRCWCAGRSSSSKSPSYSQVKYSDNSVTFKTHERCWQTSQTFSSFRCLHEFGTWLKVSLSCKRVLSEDYFLLKHTIFRNWRCVNICADSQRIRWR